MGKGLDALMTKCSAIQKGDTKKSGKKEFNNIIFPILTNDIPNVKKNIKKCLSDSFSKNKVISFEESEFKKELDEIMSIYDRFLEVQHDANVCQSYIISLECKIEAIKDEEDIKRYETEISECKYRLSNLKFKRDNRLKDFSSLENSVKKIRNEYNMAKKTNNWKLMETSKKNLDSSAQLLENSQEDISNMDLTIRKIESSIDNYNANIEQSKNNKEKRINGIEKKLKEQKLKFANLRKEQESFKEYEKIFFDRDVEDKLRNQALEKYANYLKKDLIEKVKKDIDLKCNEWVKQYKNMKSKCNEYINSHKNPLTKNGKEKLSFVKNDLISFIDGKIAKYGSLDAQKILSKYFRQNSNITDKSLIMKAFNIELEN